jgi:hypothetical protein
MLFLGQHLLRTACARRNLSSQGVNSVLCSRSTGNSTIKIIEQKLKQSMNRKLSMTLLMCSLISAGCKYDAVDCSTANVTYSTTITTIFNNNGCYSCHGTPLNSGAPFNLETHANVVAHQDRLLGALKHENGYAQMPLGKPQLSQCEINQVQAWLAAGAPDN